MQIEINTMEDLISFVEMEDVSAEQALHVAHQFLQVIPIYFSPYPKNEVIRDIKAYVERWKDLPAGHEKPLFLLQKDLDNFQVKDLVNKTDEPGNN